MSVENSTAGETMSFQAEVSRLLDIVANALYSDREIFLRELISNASDACDKLRYESLTRPELVAGDGEFRLTLIPDVEARCLTLVDNGIGMNRQDLIDNLGTIARSGTAAFMEQAAQAAKDGESKKASLIGQFGVGFYSAFMVSEEVQVTTRRAGEDKCWLWTSDGKGAFEISEVAAPEENFRGTRITLLLKDDALEFVEEQRLEHIVKRYSDHIGLPILLQPKGGEARTLNASSALWTMSKSEVTEEQYKEFYHHVGHGYGDPWMTLHFHAEGMLEYTGLLYVPDTPPFDLFDPDRKNRMKLYVKRVFITDDCQDLLPPWLRFLRGVVDTEDLPLNVSRELLQNNPMLTKIRNGVVKRVLDELKKRAKNQEESDYLKFWENFGSVLKEGLYEDFGNRDTLLEISRFRSTHGDGWTSLADYVERMKDGQEAIYYITGSDPEAMKKSPQLEGFRAKGIEVLLLSDPVDEFWLSMVGAFQEKDFRSVTRGDVDLDKVSGEDDTADDKKEDEKESAGEGLDLLLAAIKLALGDKVKDVKKSHRLTDSLVCLVASEGDMDINLERILRQHNKLDQMAQRVLEVNAKHPLISGLAGRMGGEGAPSDADTADVAWMLLDQARILEGEQIVDPQAFADRMSRLLQRGFGL